MEETLEGVPEIVAKAWQGTELPLGPRSTQLLALLGAARVRLDELADAMYQMPGQPPLGVRADAIMVQALAREVAPLEISPKTVPRVRGALRDLTDILLRWRTPAANLDPRFTFVFAEAAHAMEALVRALEWAILPELRGAMMKKGP